MRRLVVLVALGVAAALLLGGGAADAFQRYVAPQYHPMPAPQYRPVPQYRANPGGQPRVYNHVGPGAGPRLGNLGPHHLPMVSGAHGWHETYNRTHFGMIPGPLLSDGDFGPPIDFDDFVDSLDLDAPLYPVDPCTGACRWAAISYSNNGSTGISWGSSDPGSASAAALQWCTPTPNNPCKVAVATGKAWIAAIHCDWAVPGSMWSWTITALGNDAQEAVANAYRLAAQKKQFDVRSSCGVLAFVAVNGDQQQFVQKE